MDTALLIEIVGVVGGVTGVWLTIRQNTWCWPVGIVGVSLLAIVFFRARLYGSASLQIVYIILSLYGWYTWRKPTDGSRTLPVTRAPRVWLWSLFVAAGLGAAAFGWFLAGRTNASMPMLDAATTALSLVAQFLATRKWIENWYVWMVVNVTNMGMYVTQGLYPTTALYGMFLVLAIFGLRAWTASMSPRPGAAA